MRSEVREGAVFDGFVGSFSGFGFGPGAAGEGCDVRFGDEVFVREHDALGQAGRARRPKDRD